MHRREIATHDSVLGTPADRITSPLDPRAPACHAIALLLYVSLSHAHSLILLRSVDKFFEQADPAKENLCL